MHAATKRARAPRTWRNFACRSVSFNFNHPASSVCAGKPLHSAGLWVGQAPNSAGLFPLSARHPATHAAANRAAKAVSELMSPHHRWRCERILFAGRL